MSRLEKLKNARTIYDLSHMLGYQAKSLAYILYGIENEKKYTEFTIAKKSGGVRNIKAPIEQLKRLQASLSTLLYSCFDEVYDLKDYPRSLSHGFRKGHGIVTNAKTHVKQRYVFNIDLKNFFPSINFGRVRGFFINSRDFQLDPAIATIIAQIACYDNELPQGSPSSPIISNLIGHILDLRLARLAKKVKCNYSRYVDDITFSTRLKKFPVELANCDDEGAWRVSDLLSNKIKNCGFDINHKKVSMQYNSNRQMTTGLVVNEKVNISSSYYRKARSMCNEMFERGRFFVGVDEHGNEIEGTKNQLRSIVSYIYDIKSLNDLRSLDEKRKEISSIHELHRRFMYFDKFHALDKPLILCEGKTDNVYLECAIKSLKDKFPLLITEEGGKLIKKVSFLKHTDRNRDVLGFSGGIDDFPGFIKLYEKRMRRFKTKGQVHPVIICIDNDGEVGKVVNKKVKTSARNRAKGDEDFYHLVENLYVVVIPKSEKQPKAIIEDLFPDFILNMELNGKKFCSKNKNLDVETQFGKSYFADYIIVPRQDEEIFNGFEKLLKRFEACISHHYNESLT